MLIKKILSLIEIYRDRGFSILLKAILNYLHFLTFKLIFSKKTIIKQVDNYKMLLLTNDKGISRSLILFGTRERDKKFILEQIVKKNMKVFDIGANIGYYTIFLAKSLASGRILAIEPSIENVKLCERNINLNNLDTKRIKFLNAAVSNKDSVKNFHISSQTNLHTLNTEGSSKRFLTGEVRKINTFSINYLSKKFFSPDLIRMDVEGHEHEIILGMMSYIKSGSKKPHICFEPHLSTYQNNNFSNTLNRLFKLGYYTNLISSNSITGTKKITNLVNKDPFKVIPSDGEYRGIFKNLKNDCTVKILTKVGGARTVLLSPLC